MSNFISLQCQVVADSAIAFYGATAHFWDPWPERFPGISFAPMTETFAERLRRLRNEQGYTVADLAAAVGAAEGTIRHLEGGNVKSPNFLLGIRLADQLKVDPRYLALGEGIGVAERFDAIEHRLSKVEQRIASIAMTRR